MQNILLVEDDPEITRHLQDLLEEANYHVTAVSSRKTALDALEKQAYDLILLDLSLPDGSGYSVCSAIKHELDVPVIILTAMNDEASVVTGFDLGADDYVTKPFRPLELISRIKNVLRRCGKTPAVLRIAGLEIDTRRAAVSRHGEEIALTAMEYRLLLVFLNHPGEILSRNRLLEEMWDVAGDFVNDNTLTVYMKRLRDKIEDTPAAPVIIKTVRGLGYILGE